MFSVSMPSHIVYIQEPIYRFFHYKAYPRTKIQLFFMPMQEIFWVIWITFADSIEPKKSCSRQRYSQKIYYHFRTDIIWSTNNRLCTLCLCFCSHYFTNTKISNFHVDIFCQENIRCFQIPKQTNTLEFFSNICPVFFRGLLLLHIDTIIKNPAGSSLNLTCSALTLRWSEYWG